MIIELNNELQVILMKNNQSVNFFAKSFFDYNYKFNDETFDDLAILYKGICYFLDEIINKDLLIVSYGDILRVIYFYYNVLP